MINESDRDNVFKSIYTRILTNTQKSLGKVLDGLLTKSLIILLVFQNMIL